MAPGSTAMEQDRRVLKLLAGREKAAWAVVYADSLFQPARWVAIWRSLMIPLRRLP
jgi:hypothetical protein